MTNDASQSNQTRGVISEDDFEILVRMFEVRAVGVGAVMRGMRVLRAQHKELDPPRGVIDWTFVAIDCAAAVVRRVDGFAQLTLQLWRIDIIIARLVLGRSRVAPEVAAAYDRILPRLRETRAVLKKIRDQRD